MGGQTDTANASLPWRWSHPPDCLTRCNRYCHWCPIHDPDRSNSIIPGRSFDVVWGVFNMRGMGLTLPACVHFESGRAQKFTSPELHPPSLTPCLLDMLAVRPSLSSALPHMDRYGAARCNGKGSLGCSPSVPDIAYIGRAGKWSNV